MKTRSTEPNSDNLEGRMTIERVGPDASGVTVLTVSGPIRLDDLRDTLGELYTGNTPEPPVRFLWDLRDAELNWSADDIKQFSEWVRRNRQPGEGKTAVVVSRDLHFGLARMYEVFSSDLPVEFVVFRDLDAAAAWVAR